MEMAKPPVGSRRWTFVLLAVLAIFGYWASTGGEARESPLGTNVTVDVPWEQGKAAKRPAVRPRGNKAVTSVTLVSVPSGAKVWSGDKPFGDTPITVSLPSSKMHSLDLVLAGYQTHTAVVDLSIMEAGVPIELRIDLKPMDSVEHARPRNTTRARRDSRVRRAVVPRADRPRTQDAVVDPRPKRVAPRIETLDSPSRSTTGTSKRKPKIDLLE
jgi:hypothetical protein